MFYFQDSNFSESLTTHEAILTMTNQAIISSSYGFGVFAFATASGISLLFEDEVFDKFLEKNKFNLIVGIDEITNSNSIVKLQELEKKYYPNLRVNVFYHNNSNSLFHPKFIWFKSYGKITLLTGSSNLTEKALIRNKEAYTINEFEDEALVSFETYWDLWILQNQENFKSSSDSEVIRRAKLNIFRPKKKRMTTIEDTPANSDINKADVDDTNETPYEDKKHTVSIDLIDKADVHETWAIENNQDVVVAEIPNNNKRWKQANFSKEIFYKFFGASLDNDKQRRILLRNVKQKGVLEEVESRNTVKVRSRNFRVELGAVGTLDYPIGEFRPIGIFVKVATRAFVYSIFMPDDIEYQNVYDYLYEYHPVENKSNKMNRYLTKVNEIKEVCPNINLWTIKW